MSKSHVDDAVGDMHFNQFRLHTASWVVTPDLALHRYRKICGDPQDWCGWHWVLLVEVIEKLKARSMLRDGHAVPRKRSKDASQEIAVFS